MLINFEFVVLFDKLLLFFVSVDSLFGVVLDSDNSVGNLCVCVYYGILMEDV